MSGKTKNTKMMDGKRELVEGKAYTADQLQRMKDTAEWRENAFKVQAGWEKNRDTIQGVASVVPPKPFPTKERERRDRYDSMIDRPVLKKQPTRRDRDNGLQQDLKPHNQPIFGDTDSRGVLIEPKYREPKFSHYRGGGSKTQRKKTKCIKQTTKKYKTRPGPAFPANMCKGKKKLGNDKKYYLSKKNKKGVYTWKKMNKTKKK